MLIQMTKENAQYKIKSIHDKTVDTVDDSCDPLKLRYRLLALELPYEIYVITVDSDSEFSAECLGGDRSIAELAFDALLSGGATPISLSEIVRDMRISTIIEK